MPALEAAEREAIVRLLQEIHLAASADVDHRRFGMLLGFLGATAKLAAEDVRMQTGVDRLHEHADRLAEHTAELERKA